MGAPVTAALCLAATVVLSGAPTPVAAQKCRANHPYSTSCVASDGIIVVPTTIRADFPGYGENCRGFCYASPVEVVRRPCAFCTPARCESSFDRGGGEVGWSTCCPEAACTQACGIPRKGCRWNGDCTAWLCGATIGNAPAVEGSSGGGEAKSPLPSSGPSVPAPEDDGGMPTWAKILLGIGGVAAPVAAAYVTVRCVRQSDGGAAGSSACGSKAAPPRPPPTEPPQPTWTPATPAPGWAGQGWAPPPPPPLPKPAWWAPFV